VSDEPARRIAAQLERRGLSVPARLLLDAHLPLAPLVSDAGAALGPLLRVVGGRAASDVGDVLDREHGMKRLLDEIDALEKARAEPG